MRKFKFGLKYYNNLIAKNDGLIWSKFHLPRAAMQNIPELKRFETDLVKETSFFRDYNIATNKQVNEFLTEFKPDFNLAKTFLVLSTPSKTIFNLPRLPIFHTFI